ncbi:MAG: c-type cytochrome domain-containing protein [Armatimonadota bacterium]
MSHVVNRFAKLAVMFGSLLMTGVLAAAPESGVRSSRPSKVQTVSFARSIRGILSDNCYKCHGPDSKTRAAGLRLDTFSGATSKLASGRQAVIPHDQVASAAIERILLPESDPRHMPPATTQRRIKPSQLQDLRRWIDEVAAYEEQLAFT